ncbi:MAG TPA: hypothetical protein VN023_09495 [Methylovorus sp.]|nr:hypothetical protein [Methylovorus sp.]
MSFKFKRQSRVRVDWFRVIADINGMGASMVAISQHIDVPRTTVIGWKNLNAEPKHDEGQRLLMLWHEITGKSTDAVPMVGSVMLYPRLCTQTVGNPTG